MGVPHSGRDNCCGGATMAVKNWKARTQTYDVCDYCKRRLAQFMRSQNE